MKKHLAIAIYAGDTGIFGLETGTETKIRCNKAIELLLATDFDTAMIYLGAGRNPYFDHPQSLAEMMKEYLQKEFIKHNFIEKISFRISSKNVWGTVKETLAIVEMLKEDCVGELHIISSRYHLFPRIVRIWNMIGQKYRIHPLPVEYTVKNSFLLERIKLIKVWALLIPYKIKTALCPIIMPDKKLA